MGYPINCPGTNIKNSTTMPHLRPVRYQYPAVPTLRPITIIMSRIDTPAPTLMPQLPLTKSISLYLSTIKAYSNSIKIRGKTTNYD